jgi:serine/threonine-protein kinase
MTSEQAAKALGDAGLKGDPRPTQRSGCTPGEVLDQNPKFGIKAKRGDQVDYTVCAAPNQVAIPTLKGFSVADAQEALKEKGLNFKLEPVDGVQKDTVVDTSPAAGSLATPGDTVTLKVSNGNLAQVPDLSGLTQDQARDKLREAGFTSNPRFTNRTTTDEAQNGKVVGQDPSAGSERKKNATISVFIGKVQDTPASPPASPSSSASPAS